MLGGSVAAAATARAPLLPMLRRRRPVVTDS